MDEEDYDTTHHFLEEEMEIDELAQSILLDSSSDEEEPKQWGGSREGRTPNKNRDFIGAAAQLDRDYFNGPESTHSEADFERRFRMPRVVYEEIEAAVLGEEPFVQKKDIVGKPGVNPRVKLVACLRHLAYGDSYDREDENLRISASVLHGLVRAFNKIVIRKLGPQHLNRCPTRAERDAISIKMSKKGFPGCIASWDCKHFTWENCPLRWAGSHDGHGNGKTLILEAIADHRKCTWMANFGDAGSMNDINVLDKSSIVGAMMSGELSLKTEQYTINGNPRDWNYFLVDGIYPPWAIFVTTHHGTKDPAKLNFAKKQEAVRKDIECAFGILVKRFHVLKRPLRTWYLPQITDLIHCCVILHNMITLERCGRVADLEDEEEDDVDVGNAFALFGKPQSTAAEAEADGVDLFAARLRNFNAALQSHFQHNALRKDLVAHHIN